MKIFLTARALMLCAAAAAASVNSLPAAAATPPVRRPMPPYLSPADSLKLIQLAPGYRLELVLSEPQIQEPVVTVFDGNGRMFVAEMRSYMKDIDGTDEKTPTSRVSMHWSSKGDGVFDQHSVFIDKLVLPRQILPLRDSLLVQETDSGDIYEYRDTDGDGVADEKKLFFAGEARKANLEHQTSGLIWAQDNWLYSTYSSFRLRWTPRGVEKETTTPNGGQWGLTQDNYGKPWIVNAGGELGPINFQQPVAYGIFKLRNEFAPGYTEVWPLVPIPDVQGGTSRFRPDAKTLNHFTATCGADIYRGDRLPADLVGDLLFCEPVGRLIRRTKIAVKDGVTTLSNPYAQSEFIRSSDPYFRPINLVTAPDGAIYVTDMYRGVIQESNWTKKGSYLRSVIQEYALDQNVGGGRIWRLVHDGATLGATPNMLGETPAQLVAHLAHPNGWWRDTAQKLLILQQDVSVVPALQIMARTHSDSLARQHALWTLEGLEALDPAIIREKLRDADTHVRVAAIRAAESLCKRGDTSLSADILALFKDASPEVAVQAMLTANLLKWPEAKPLIQKIAVASSSVGVKEIAAQVLNPLAAQVAVGYGGEQRALLEHGQQIFMELCFACHGLDGRGTPLEGRALTLAPPLAGSATLLSHRDAAINAILYGVSGPVAGHTYEAQMAPMGANDDEWLAAVTSYVRTGFGNRGSVVTPKDIARVRAATTGRTEAWTLPELQQSVPQPLADRSAWKFTGSSGPKDQPAAFTWDKPAGITVTPAQAPGAWFQIELTEPALLTDLRLESVKNPRNYPRGYTVALSEDGITWSPPVAKGQGSGPVLEISFQPARAKWVRITQTGSAGNVPWTVDGLVLFGRPAPATGAQ